MEAVNAARRNVAPARISRDQGVSFDLTLSPAAYEMLNGFTRESGDSIDILVRKALVLLDVAYSARRDKKHLGIATDPSVLETEIEI